MEESAALIGDKIGIGVYYLLSVREVKIPNWSIWKKGPTQRSMLVLFIYRIGILVDIISFFRLVFLIGQCKQGATKLP